MSGPIRSIMSSCPCEGLGILMREEAPHQNPEICKNALATALIGRRETTLLGQLEAVDRELGRIQNAGNDGSADEVLRHARIARAELGRAVALVKGER